MRFKSYKLGSLLLLGVTLFAASCFKDLDTSPLSPNETTAATAFDNPDAYKQVLAKLYGGFATSGQQGPAGQPDIQGIDEGFSNYLRQYWKAQELSTDEAVIAWNDGTIQDFHQQDWDANSEFITAMYNRIFYQIAACNEYIRETADAKLDSRGVSGALRTDIEKFRAEARFIRALCYWHALDMFRSVPFVTEADAVGSFFPRQASAEEVFNYVESELKAIENLLVPARQNEYGRADRAALWMLQAKLYLNAEVYAGSNRYTDCVAACKKVIDSGVYSLQDNYRELFMADNNLSPEVIFAIPFDGLNTQTWGGTTYLVHAALGGKMVDNMNDLTGAELKDEAAKVYGVNSGWFGLRTTSAIVDLFPDVSGVTDERAIFYIDGQSKEIGENGIGNFNEGFAVPKYTNLTSLGDPGSDLTHTDTDFPMFRLADAYLMYAEAVLRGGSGGDAGTAVNYINALRQRAYNNDSGNITANDLTLDFILDERARELYWEGHRRTDLVRFNLFTENGIWPHKGGVPEGKTTDPYRNLYPIPAGEILANPKLQQNPGYF